MTEKITIELPQEVAQQVRMIAAHTQRSFEDVVVDWMRRIGAEPVLELLPDAEVLRLCDLQLRAPEDEELHERLERHREGPLPTAEQGRLDELMGAYRAGLVRTAQALKVAVSRGLRARLS